MRGQICFHAPLIYPLLASERIEFAGGAQVQQLAMAEGLIARGFEVSMVCYDYGQPALETRRGLVLHRSLRVSDGWPGLRFFPRLWKTLGALARADAEVYVTRGQGWWCGVTCAAAHRRCASYVMSIAHDDDVRARLEKIGNPRDRWSHRHALRHADRVIVQSAGQREDLRRDFGREGDVVRNLVAVPSELVDAGAARRVVWLATYAASKRPRWFVELARRMPEHRFVMAGTLLPPPNPTTEWDECRAEAATIPNLDVRGFVARDEMDAFYRDAALFVHTSPAEGVPNALLEAWAHGVPSVNGVDPEGATRTHGLGEVAHDLDGFTAAVGRWMADPDARRAAGQRARAYVRGHYDSEQGMDRLAELFGGEVERVRSRRRRSPAPALPRDVSAGP